MPVQTQTVQTAQTVSAAATAATSLRITRTPGQFTGATVRDTGDLLLPLPEVSDIDEKTALANALASVAMEETSISRLIKKEAEKVQTVLGMSDLEAEDLVAINESVTRLSGSISRIEDALARKVDCVTELLVPHQQVDLGITNFAGIGMIATYYLLNDNGTAGFAAAVPGKNTRGKTLMTIDGTQRAVDPAEVIEEVTSDESGHLCLSLKAGKYLLVFKSAADPDYTDPVGTHRLVVTSDGTVTVDGQPITNTTALQLINTQDA